MGHGGCDLGTEETRHPNSRPNNCVTARPRPSHAVRSGSRNTAPDQPQCARTPRPATTCAGSSLPCNRQVVGSSPTTGSPKFQLSRHALRRPTYRLCRCPTQGPARRTRGRRCDEACGIGSRVRGTCASSPGVMSSPRRRRALTWCDVRLRYRFRARTGPPPGPCVASTRRVRTESGSRRTVRVPTASLPAGQQASRPAGQQASSGRLCQQGTTLPATEGSPVTPGAAQLPSRGELGRWTAA